MLCCDKLMKAGCIMDSNQINHTIEQKIAHFMSLISEETNSDLNAQSFSRYKSWEWCYKYFKDHHDLARLSDDEKESIIDTMALHLAFYLASWGMYRGSSFLLQRDYKAHIPAVKAILDLDKNLNQGKKYDSLWNFVPSEKNIDDAYELLFGEDGIYFKVKKSYKKNCNDGADETSQNGDKSADSEGLASDTLVTKILLGTFGCIPAFDRYLKNGIKISNGQGYTKEFATNIEGKNHDIFKKLCHLYIDNISNVNLNSLVEYPPMKKVDMFFWEIGYEADIKKQLCALMSDIKTLMSDIKKSKNRDVSIQRKFNKIEYLFSLLEKMKVDIIDLEKGEKITYDELKAKYDK